MHLLYPMHLLYRSRAVGLQRREGVRQPGSAGRASGSAYQLRPKETRRRQASAGKKGGGKFHQEDRADPGLGV